eukprot:1810582-Rhodomonas_salina.1
MFYAKMTKSVCIDQCRKDVVSLEQVIRPLVIPYHSGSLGQSHIMSLFCGCIQPPSSVQWSSSQIRSSPELWKEVVVVQFFKSSRNKPPISITPKKFKTGNADEWDREEPAGRTKGR